MKFEKLKKTFGGFVSFSDEEFNTFLRLCEVKTFAKNEVLLQQGEVCHSVFYVNSGFCRTRIIDSKGIEYTFNFAMENDFVSDYSSFVRERPSTLAIQAIENTEVIHMPRLAIEAAYNETQNGNKLGRLIAEYYFQLLQELLEIRRTKKPLELYEFLNVRYPNIYQRAPQTMLASFLGISSVHLSRLKSQAVKRSN